MQAFHKSHLLKLRVAPSETAMTDVLREVFYWVFLSVLLIAVFICLLINGVLLTDRQVLIMKMLNHPNIVNLIEVIDDPNTDHFYMGTKGHNPSIPCRFLVRVSEFYIIFVFSFQF